VAISLLASFSAPALFTTAARADSIDDKRAQAEAIAQEIEANGMRISQFDEELLEAQLTLDELSAHIGAANADIDTTRKQARSRGNDLADRATVLYMSGGSSTAMLPALDSDDFSEAGARQIYLETAAERDTEIINDLQASNKKLGEQVDELEAARAQTETEQLRLDNARAELERANTRQAELLAETEGELADLIAEEQARQAREAEAAARLEQERQSQQNDSNSGNSGDSGNSDDGSGDSGSNGGNNGDNSGNGGGSDITVVAPNPRAQTAVDAALAQVGKPYSYATPGSWDVEDPPTFDCSGLTGWAWYRAGVSLPHQSGQQYAMLPHVAREELLPGDLVFYGSPIHHVGMYIGNGEYVNAPYTGAFVRVSTIYRNEWAGAARIPG
jgi:cell wall-associated NlpC family hydrolase